MKRKPNTFAQFNIRIREAREWSGLSQDAAAGQLGIARQTMYNLEAGNTVPRADMIVELAELYERPVLWFYGIDEDPDPRSTVAVNNELEKLQITLHRVSKVLGFKR